MTNFSFILKQRKMILALLASFFLIEIFSFLSFYFPILNSIFFLIISLVVLVLAVYKLEWAFYVLLAELFINSMGYIFFFETGGFKISIRIALWLIIIAVWLAKFLIDLMRQKKVVWQQYAKLPFLKSWLFLGLFIVIALVSGIIKNGFSDAFFDFNAWLYFALIFPLWGIISSSTNPNNFKKNVVNIFVAGVSFLVLKSLLFLFLFSHNVAIILDLYRWSRAYYLGEITAMSGGFYRVFLQPQIYILFSFLILISSWVFTTSKKIKVYLLVALSLLASALILNFSRSFWLGAVVGLALLFLLLWIKFGFKKMIMTFSIFLLSFVIGFLLVFSILKFPWPNADVNFNLNSLSERANIKSGESAISSRWALLEVMKDDVANNFLLGRGFGARLEYQSSDPRVLEQTADGVYSTYAFEWGWFDIWLKLGLIGVASYLFLLYLILKNYWKNFAFSNSFIYLGLSLSLISLVAVNFFTPYLNHPLGIGFLILIALLWVKESPITSENER